MINYSLVIRSVNSNLSEINQAKSGINKAKEKESLVWDSFGVNAEFSSDMLIYLLIHNNTAFIT